ncbi:MAG: hypothetical protein ABIM30_00640 [candidate division WOR-3 bacterium]
MRLNETANIISPKRSPIFLQAVYRNILCYVFQHNNIPNDSNPLHWDPDVKKTDILIELDDNDNIEVRQKRPAIIISSSGMTINDQIAIGQGRERISLTEGVNQRHAFAQTNITLHIDSCQKEESKALAYIVAAIVCTAHQAIRGEFNIHHIDPVYISQTSEINIGEGYYRTSITFNIITDFTWFTSKLDFPVEKIVGVVVKQE